MKKRLSVGICQASEGCIYNEIEEMHPRTLFDNIEQINLTNIIPIWAAPVEVDELKTKLVAA
ncbi:unnamed protein product [Dovyalis caffra]|uniref:Uncharacterized protein n=1 Tax=Dovyalis caffra TaxID=77055 RepID=A0AAV1RU12_9ROSI|nr:unnamed protein product [Dovyalis caffra]